MPDDCEQFAIDNDWSLARTNACHIGVMNSEMGELRDKQIEMNGQMATMDLKLSLIVGIISVCAVSLVGLVIKKMWGKC